METEKKLLAPPRITVVIPTDDFSSPEKMEEILPEQSLLMAALNGDDVRELRKQITNPTESRLENTYYVDLIDYATTANQTFAVPQPTETNFVSAANDVLGEINKFIISAPGSLHKVGSNGVEKKPVNFFNYLHTSTISTMTPKAELALAIRDLDGTLIKTVPFIFSNFNRANNIENMLNQKYDRGFGVALESVSITSDAQDPALSKFVTCDITVRLSNAKYLDHYVNNTYQLDKQSRETKELFIEDLFYTNKHERQAFSSSTPWKKAKTHNAEIKLTLGYASPNPATLPKNSKEKTLIEDNLHNMTQTFFLKPVDYDIIAEQTGQVVLTIKYASSFDADMDSKSRKTVPTTDGEKKAARDSAILGALRDQVVKYKREHGDTMDYSEVDRFISYSRQAVAVAGLKARETRARQIIDRITHRGQRSLVLPYTISGLDSYTPPKQVVDGNAEVDTSSEKPSLIVDYDFATPTSRPRYLTRNKEQNLNSNELRAIEFVLFGEIIDYVFEEFFSVSADPSKPEYAESKAAIFSAFSFGIYDSNFKTKVDKLYGMRDAPVSLDILWDMLMNSPITEANGGFPKARYYKDLVSNIYSHIYKSCDKAISLLMSETTFESTSHTLRKIGVPEINAHEIYLPKASLEALAETRTANRGYLGKQDIWDTLMHAIKAGNNGAQTSGSPDLDDYCLVLFFTSHIPFSPVDQSRGVDYEFDSFGQKGIVKGFSYSPVAIDGLLESAIASRTADSTPGGVDGDDKFYKSLLKVDISTFGFPVVTPGMTVKVSEVLLGLQPGSKMSNSITKSYYVTRVQTTMNKGDYTTVIEGYPQLDALKGETGAIKAKNSTLIGNDKFITDTMFNAYGQFKKSSRGSSAESPTELVRRFINNKFYGKNNDGMKGFFPQLVPPYNNKFIPRKITIEKERLHWNLSMGTTAARYYGPGRFGKLKRGYEDDDLVYLNQLDLYGDNYPYPFSSHECLEVSEKVYRSVVKENRKKLDSLYENLGITKDSYFPEIPGNQIVDESYADVEMLTLAAYRIVKAIDESYIPRWELVSTDNPNMSSPDDGNIRFKDYSIACRTFMEIMQSCSAIWREQIKEIAESMEDDPKGWLIAKMSNTTETKDPKTYGLTAVSQAEIADILKKITDKVEEEHHVEIMADLQKALKEIINEELPL